MRLLSLPSVLLRCCTVLLVSLSLSLSLSQLCPTHNNQGIAIWSIKQINVRSDMVVEIFSQSSLGSPACVAWRTVLLPDVGSSSSHPLDPRQYYILLALDVSLHIVSEIMWEDGGLMPPSIQTTSNAIMLTVCLVFITIDSSGGDRARQKLFCRFII